MISLSEMWSVSYPTRRWCASGTAFGGRGASIAPSVSARTDDEPMDGLDVATALTLFRPVHDPFFSFQSPPLRLRLIHHRASLVSSCILRQRGRISGELSRARKRQCEAHRPPRPNRVLLLRQMSVVASLKTFQPASCQLELLCSPQLNQMIQLQ